MERHGITPVVAMVLLLMMTVAAAGGAYVWFSGMLQQSQQEAREDLATGLTVRDAVCEPGAVRVAVHNTGSTAVDASSVDVLVYTMSGDLVTSRPDRDYSWAGFTAPDGFDRVGTLLTTTLQPGDRYRVELRVGDATVSGRCTVEEGALPGAVGGYDAPTSYSRTVRLEAAGLSASDTTHGYWIDGSKVYTQGRSYGLMVIDRDTGTVTSTTTFDVYGNADEAENLNDTLAGLAQDKLALVNTYDEPQNNRLTNDLPRTMKRFGASQTFTSPAFKYRSAYMLIGSNGLGVGNGIEYYRGNVDNDPDAHIRKTFRLVDGNIGLNTTYR